MAWTQAGSFKGPKGDTGTKGDTGAVGRGVASTSINGSGELVVNFTDGTNANLGRIVGTDGAKGADGTSVTITGSVSTASQLPTNLTSADKGKGYIAQDTGNLHVWSGTAFTNVGVIKGPKGDKGDKGDTGSQGLQGIPGNDGANGARGTKWFYGDGAPSGSITGSQAGDFYIDRTTGNFYELT